MKILLAILALFLIYQVVARILARFVDFPAPTWTGPYFDSKLRRKVQSSEVLLQRSGVKKGMKIMDLGCGSGAFTTSAARKVGEEGRVYALDVQKGMLAQVEKKLSKPENQDIKNVELVHASAEELPLDNESLDLVFMVGVLGEIPDQKKAMKEIKRVLKPGGRLAITELLPDPHYRLKSTVVKLGEEAGFEVDEISGHFWNYCVRLVKR
jgi:ubiquinone/menaquinone biosynthesis C-methylase UbiE